jgi:hypothetical protein
MQVAKIVMPVLATAVGAGLGIAFSGSIDRDGLQLGEAGGGGAATLVAGTVGYYAGKDLGGFSGGVAGSLALGGFMAAAVLGANLIDQ